MSTRRDAARTPIAEWVAAGIGAALLAAMLTVIVYRIVTAPAVPPDIRVQIATITPLRSEFLVQFVAVNDAGSTAQSVHIRGDLLDRGTVIESADAQLQFVPGHSSARGGLLFVHDPRSGTLRVRAVGYELP